MRRTSKLKFLRLDHERVYNPHALEQGDDQHIYVVVADEKGRQEFIEIPRASLLPLARTALRIHEDAAQETIKYRRWRREVS